MSSGYSVTYRKEGHGLPIAVELGLKTIGHIFEDERGWRFTSSTTNQSGCLFDTYEELVDALENDL